MRSFGKVQRFSLPEFFQESDRRVKVIKGNKQCIFLSPFTHLLFTVVLPRKHFDIPTDSVKSFNVRKEPDSFLEAATITAEQD